MPSFGLMSVIAQVLLVICSRQILLAGMDLFCYCRLNVQQLRPLWTFNIRTFFMETFDREYDIVRTFSFLTVIAQVIAVLKQ